MALTATAFLVQDAAGNNYVVNPDLQAMVPVTSADAAVLTTAGYTTLAVSTALVSSIRTAR